jgi:hypothetical protein
MSGLTNSPVTHAETTSDKPLITDLTTFIFTFPGEATSALTLDTHLLSGWNPIGYACRSQNSEVGLPNLAPLVPGRCRNATTPAAPGRLLQQPPWLFSPKPAPHRAAQTSVLELTSMMEYGWNNCKLFV